MPHRSMTFVLGLVLAAPVMAAAPSASAVTPPRSTAAIAPAAQAAPGLNPGNRRFQLSVEGNAIAMRVMGTPDPRAAEIRAEMAKIREQKMALIRGPSVDVTALEQLFRREETLQAEFLTRQNDRLLTLLRALPDPDRITLLQGLANPVRPPAPVAPPGAPATKPAKPAN